MRKMSRTREQSGFTLAEVLITAVVFLLFSTVLFGLLINGLNYFKAADADFSAQTTCRNIMEIIVSELRQAVPNPDPGLANSPTGYLSIAPNAAPTAILYPNYLNKTGNYLIFTEPNHSNFDPSESSFSDMDPSNYQRIRYYVQNGNTLMREITKYDSNGSVASTESDQVAEVPNGEIVMEIEFVSTKKVELTVTVTEAKGQSHERTYTGNNRVFIAVGN